MTDDGYKYDVFISLSHMGEWIEWLDERFLNRFLHYLSTELGRHVEHYVARHRMFPGATWPMELAESHARSRTLLALCTFPYQQSDWCKLEYSMMRAREESVGLRVVRSGGLIVPVIAHDCDPKPSFLSGIEPMSIIGLTYRYLCPTSPEAQQLDQRIEKIAIGAAKAIQCAPPFDSRWNDLNCERFMRLFRKHQRNRKNPRLS